MTNQEVFKEYGSEQWVIEQNLCFLLQTYWEEYGKKAIKDANNGYAATCMPYSPVSFVKEFMRDETLCDIAHAEKSKMASIENNVVTDTDFIELH